MLISHFECQYLARFSHRNINGFGQQNHLPKVIQIDVKDDEITLNVLDPVEKTTAKKKRHPAKNKANQV